MTECNNEPDRSTGVLKWNFYLPKEVLLLMEQIRMTPICSVQWREIMIDVGRLSVDHRSYLLDLVLARLAEHGARR